MKKFSLEVGLQTFKSVLGNTQTNKRNPVFIEDMETILSLCSEKDMSIFVKTFNKLVKDTYEQFIPVPIETRKYYSLFFYNKMYDFVSKHINKMDDNSMKSYCFNLFNAFAKSKILKNYSLYIDKQQPQTLVEQLTDEDFDASVREALINFVENPEDVTYKKENTDTTDPVIESINLQPKKEETSTTIDLSAPNVSVTEEPKPERKPKIRRNNIQLNEW